MAAPLATGSAPGNPRHTGQTCVLGGAPNAVEQPQNIFDLVRSCTCVSSPMIVSQAGGVTRRSGGGTAGGRGGVPTARGTNNTPGGIGNPRPTDTSKKIHSY